LTVTLLVPTHIQPDDNVLNNIDGSTTRTIAGNVTFKSVPTMEV
jgi:hypothetical protein